MPDRCSRMWSIKFQNCCRDSGSTPVVEDEQVGVVDQRAAEADLLLHTTRELACGPVGERA
jgi:hypothetical protein